MGNFPSHFTKLALPDTKPTSQMGKREIATQFHKYRRKILENCMQLYV